MKDFDIFRINRSLNQLLNYHERILVNVTIKIFWLHHTYSDIVRHHTEYQFQQL